MFELVFQQEEYKSQAGEAENLGSIKHSRAVTAMIQTLHPPLSIHLIYS